MSRLIAAAIVPALIVSLLAPLTASAATVSLATLYGELSTSNSNPGGYDRGLFTQWIDADGDGCDTRREVLIAESVSAPVVGTGCAVSGEWNSWYDGVTWTTSTDVDIDHMVPLSEAWRSGASTWTSQQRRAYANDLELDASLAAVTDNVNQSKGDSDPAQWMPPAAGMECRYITDWVLVKYRWNLTMDSAERAAIDSVMDSGCSDTLVAVPAKASTLSAIADVSRLAGADRFATSVAVAKQSPTGVAVVYIANGFNYPDALSAAPAAAVQGGPLLLTDPLALPDVVRNEIVRLQPAQIVVVGGVAAVSDVVFQELSALAPTRRDSGVDRFETSQVVNRRAFTGGASAAFIASGLNFPDALSASAAAGSSASPVILVNGTATTLDPSTGDLLAQLDATTVYIAGGTAVIAPTIERDLVNNSYNVQRFGGADRYETSSLVNRGIFTSAQTAYMAVGTGFADALAGAALAGRDGSPLFIVPRDCVTPSVPADFVALGVAQRVLLGGLASLGEGVENLEICAPPAPPPPATPPPVLPPPPGAPTNPGDSMNCSNFPNYAAAKAWFDRYNPYYGDIARLDGNNDGVPCESLPGAP